MIEMAETYIDDENEVMLPDLTIKPIESQEAQNQIQKTSFKASQNKFTNPQEPRNLSRGSRKKRKKPIKNEVQSESQVDIPKEIRVYGFADKLNKQPSEII